MVISQVVWSGIVAGSVYALVALSFALIYNVTKFFNFTHAFIFTLGGYLALVGLQWLHWPFAVVIVLSSALSGCVGILTEVLCFGPIRRRGGTSMILLLASLGLYIALQNVISLVFGDESKSLYLSGTVIEGHALGGAHITMVQVSTVAITWMLLFFSMAAFRLTRTGRAYRAVTIDAELAKIDGVDVDRIVMGAYWIGSALAGLASILVALDIDMNPTMGFTIVMMGVIAMIVGGVRSSVGIGLGGIAVGIFQQFAGWSIGGNWQDAIAFLLLLAFLLVKPYSLVGRPPRKARI